VAKATILHLALFLQPAAGVVRITTSVQTLAAQAVPVAAVREALLAVIMVLETREDILPQKVITVAPLMMILPVAEAAQAQLVGLEQVGHRLEMVAQAHHLPYPAPLSHELAAVVAVAVPPIHLVLEELAGVVAVVTPLMLQLMEAQILAAVAAVAVATQTKVVEMAAPVLSSSAMPILLQQQQRQQALQPLLLLVAIVCINGLVLVPSRSKQL
jgi:hypothetical protein